MSEILAVGMVAMSEVLAVGMVAMFEVLAVGMMAMSEVLAVEWWRCLRFCLSELNEIFGIRLESGIGRLVSLRLRRNLPREFILVIPLSVVAMTF